MKTLKINQMTPNKEQPTPTYISSPETFYNEDSMLWETHVGELLEGDRLGKLWVTAHAKTKEHSRRLAKWLANQLQKAALFEQ